ncbi:MAG: redox-regulated ATPase YchF [Anaerolineae bacterium]
MAVELGIVGLPNVGKSTLFNALTKAHALVASYPFTTIEPNIGVVPVPDERLQNIAAIVKPEKVVPSTLRVVDIAGLVKGASKGEGLGNQFLSHIRTVDAIAMVVRAFRNPDIPHVTAELDPVQDVETVQLELILADVATVERRQEKTKSAAKAKPAEFEAELAALEALRQHLNQGLLIRGANLPPLEMELAHEMNLLTAKPLLYVANVGEEDLPDGGPLVESLRRLAEREEAELVVICAQCEAELADWPEEEAIGYLRELGVQEPGLRRFINAGYRLLSLITFFTITGGKEVRAWPIQRGTTVIEAAGRIHSDMQRGFIRAEVMRYQDLVQAGSATAVREKGLLHLEGRDYIVQDGDIIHIRFSV